VLAAAAEVRSLTGLAHELCLPLPTVDGIAQRLEARGLVAREGDQILTLAAIADADCRADAGFPEEDPNEANEARTLAVIASGRVDADSGRFR
jgi:hypothetical protein